MMMMMMMMIYFKIYIEVTLRMHVVGNIR